MTILRFNWPLYLAAALVLLASTTGSFMTLSVALKLACGAAAACSTYFIFISLGVSHLIYDRSDLYRWRWMERAFQGMTPQHIVFCHAGFDEASQILKDKLPPADWRVLDHFDPHHMSEPSILRARRLFPPTPETVASPYDRWPVESGSMDAVIALLAIHEFRSEAERTAWFGEARRCLKSGGRIILAEHVRDFANFAAFGPGFFHFHTRTNWRRCWEEAGLQASDEFRITPWVRVFIIIPPC